mgnify:CR=1 FL=1|tara:strand:- start:22 stop:411 length:390 start_codon:yes stop_codon:yes gene_type:complete
MKLKKVENVKSTRQGVSCINIAKKGSFHFSSKACEEHNLIDKKVEFFQDEESPESWYFSFSDAEEALHIKLHSDKKSAHFSSSYLANKIRPLLNYDDSMGSLRALIGKPFEDKGRKYFPLLMKKAERKL